MRVLGIDPGTVITGWGVVESKGSGFRHVAHGSIRTSAEASLPDRLGCIFSGVSAVIREHQPEVGRVDEILVYIKFLFGI